MKEHYLRVIEAFVLGALWIPLLYVVTALNERYGLEAPLSRLAWWEMTLVIALILMPVAATYAIRSAGNGPAVRQADPPAPSHFRDRST